MTEQDITRIRVGKHPVSIIGLKGIMEEMASDFAGRSDREVADHMLERLSRKNYLPGTVQSEYAAAFVREFRKFMGQPYSPEGADDLDIKVLGMGCGACHALVQAVMQVLTETGIPANVDHVQDIKEIAKYGVLGLPALIIGEKVVAAGRPPAREKLRELLLEAARKQTG